MYIVTVTSPTRSVLLCSLKLSVFCFDHLCIFKPVVTNWNGSVKTDACDGQFINHSTYWL